MNILTAHDWNVWYAGQHALKDISITIPSGQLTAIIGPSGCGKTTLLKSFNRLLELNEDIRTSGKLMLGDTEIYGGKTDVTEIRTRIGLLPQKPFPLPMSIYDNVAYPLRIHGLAGGEFLKEKVHHALVRAALWDEVKDRLKDPAAGLSVGQQQRLCLARALTVEPEVLLCDESTSALDPISARNVEALLISLKGDYTIVIVTHDVEQARRLADHAVFMWLGEVAEARPAEEFFSAPATDLSKKYLAHEIG